jgi:NAD-dependent dihydropyrimidine dehydrogenase PreA subunit
VVVYPEGCVEGCRGCQNLCPSGAIEYVGDTGEKGNCSCGCCSC